MFCSSAVAAAETPAGMLQDVVKILKQQLPEYSWKAHKQGEVVRYCDSSKASAAALIASWSCCHTPEQQLLHKHQHDLRHSPVTACQLLGCVCS